MLQVMRLKRSCQEEVLHPRLEVHVFGITNHPQAYAVLCVAQSEPEPFIPESCSDRFYSSLTSSNDLFKEIISPFLSYHVAVWKEHLRVRKLH
jgi:hypothetical protein